MVLSVLLCPQLDARTMAFRILFFVRKCWFSNHCQCKVKPHIVFQRKALFTVVIWKNEIYFKRFQHFLNIYLIQYILESRKKLQICCIHFWIMQFSTKLQKYIFLLFEINLESFQHHKIYAFWFTQFSSSSFLFFLIEKILVVFYYSV
ncbi:Uncharacterized protein TCM_020435 [Theobroma cacao]|uniref:Uncharacterized protein n=1 Tax=Theobroma cacao TaxID=3641 RepID=A0A061ESZ1_THECC|nr:Uncharacterized protein TCM_020435 [Theobroma cacao]